MKEVRSSSRSPSPSPVRQKSRDLQTDYFEKIFSHLGKHTFIVIISIIYGIFSGLSSSSWINFCFRMVALFVTIYLINFIFYKKGARSITEKFFMAFTVVAYTYFVVSCPLGFFIPSLILCFIIAAGYYQL